MRPFLRSLGMRLHRLAIVPLLLLGAPAPRPGLTVLVVLDGLRGDLIDRYDTLFTGGFKRIHDQGFTYHRAMVDHGVTVSHAGHVTIETGRQPSHHGIVDAGYYVPAAGGGRRLQDAVDDSTTHLVGTSDARSAASPRQVLATGFSDWVRAANPRAQVVAVGTGRYSSLLHVFQPGAAVVWYDRTAGKYVTSSFYLDTLPSWVRQFNDAPLDAIADSATEWLPSYDPRRVHLGRSDTSAWERYGTRSAFPHRLADEAPGRAFTAQLKRAWLETTPYIDRATLALASQSVRTLALGQRDTRDYLSIVLSASDNTGHDYGPNSHEMLDVLLRYDRWLGEFMAGLDRTVGAGKWTIAITADHGMAELPEWTAAHDHPAWRIADSMTGRLMNDVRELAAAGRTAAMPGLARGRPWIARFYSPADLAGRTMPDTFIALLRHSWRRDRVPRLPIFDTDSAASAIAAAGWMVRLSPGSMIDLDPGNHGSPYDYDRHVPLLFLGAGVMHGSSHGVARTVDIAPTLAALSGIAAAAGVDGRALPVSRRP